MGSINPKRITLEVSVKKGLLALALFGFSLSLSNLCSADIDEGWEARISAAYDPLAINAKTTVEGQEASFVSDSGDFMSANNSGIQVRAEAWKGRLGITADNVVEYFDVQSRVDQSATVSLSGYNLSTELGVSYIVGTLPVSSASKIDFEAMGGGRFVILKQQLEFEPGDDVSDKKAYAEPFLGSRITWVFNKLWSFDVRGNIGGFGIGNASQLTWVLVPKFNFSFSKSALINVGYKVVDIETEQETGAERTQLVGRMFGPFIGAEFRFATGE